MVTPAAWTVPSLLTTTVARAVAPVTEPVRVTPVKVPGVPDEPAVIAPRAVIGPPEKIKTFRTFEIGMGVAGETACGEPPGVKNSSTAIKWFLL
jgi:hypothetical protein